MLAPPIPSARRESSAWPAGVARASNGAVCQSGDACVSAFCVGASADVLGVCCSSACDGPCESCNQTGSLGICTYLPAGFTDPACNGTDRTTCGYNGLCDGLGSCTLYPKDTVCGSSSCSGLIENTPRTCDGKGTCQDSQLVDCSPYVCSSDACVPNCASGNDCASGFQCNLQSSSGGSCGLRKNGQPCSDSSGCESGQCVDGVCCESSCTGPCQSCNLPGSPGTMPERGQRHPRSARRLQGFRPSRLFDQWAVRRHRGLPELRGWNLMRARNLHLRGLHAAPHVQCVEPVCGFTFSHLQPLPVQRK